MQHKSRKHLVGHSGHLLLVRTQRHEAPEIIHAPLAAAHGFRQFSFVDLFARFRFNKRFHAAQLLSHILHRLFILPVRHINHVLLHTEEVRQTAERQEIGVTGQGRIDNKARLGISPFPPRQ